MNMVEFSTRHRKQGQDLIHRLLTEPPRGYVFLIIASQDSYYDLFMLTLLKEAITEELPTLEVVTEARNRQVMQDIASHQNERFRILEINYGQETFGQHTCSPHLHEINIMMRELRNVYGPQVVVFEGLTPLLIDFSARDVVLFFKESVEESIKTGSVEFYLIHENTADNITMNQLNALAHGIITLNTSRGKHYMTVKKSLGVELPYNPIEYVPLMPSPDRTTWQIMLNW